MVYNQNQNLAWLEYNPLPNKAIKDQLDKQLVI
jgi:hypothetical protein